MDYPSDPIRSTEPNPIRNMRGIIDVQRQFAANAMDEYQAITWSYLLNVLGALEREINALSLFYPK